MLTRYVFSSLTRIAPLDQVPFTIEPLPRADWATGDYVVCKVHEVPTGYREIELPTGRKMEAFLGDQVIGALGTRYATLEATGSWTEMGDDGVLHVLTRAGLLGTLTSKSPYMADVMGVRYQGHVLVDGEKATMQRYVKPVPEQAFEMPVVLIVGTSMSAGKTMSAKVVVRLLKEEGYTVLGAKLTGAGRLRDILAMVDAGADYVFDFVDAGLPSTVVPEADYRTALQGLLARMGAVEADVAVIEIGASPLEPYNGATAIKAIQKNVHSTILCAFDPYAAYGVMNAFQIYPSMVAGVATNTRAGVDLIEKLCGVRALNLYDPEMLPALKEILLSELEGFLQAPLFWGP